MKQLLLLLFAFDSMAAQYFYDLDETAELKINVDAENASLVSGALIGPETDCILHQPPVGTTAQTMSYEAFSGNPFGDSTSSSFSFAIPINKYATFPVTTPLTLYLRKNSFEQPTANYTPASYTVSLSKCPGDFNVSSPDVGRGRCVVGGQYAGGSTAPVLRWTTKDNPSPTDLVVKCILEKNTLYYLNIIHSTVPPYTDSVCTDASGCGVLFTELIDN